MQKISRAAFFAVLSILTIFIAFSGCTDKTKISDETDLRILTGNTCWSPAMSSIIGIDITPEYTGESGCVFHWTATGDTGSKVQFISWGDETKGEIIREGNDTWTNPGETLWWNYDNFEIETMPEKFTLRVEAVDKNTNKTLAFKDAVISRKVMLFCIE